MTVKGDVAGSWFVGAGIPENVVRSSCLSERGRSADVRQSLVQNLVQPCDVTRESAVWQCNSET